MDGVGPTGTITSSGMAAVRNNEEIKMVATVVPTNHLVVVVDTRNRQGARLLTGFRGLSPFQAKS